MTAPTISERTRAWYHGCWDRPGHFLWTITGDHVWDRGFPANVIPRGLDGGFAPRELEGRIFYPMQYAGNDAELRRNFDRGAERPQGQFLVHRLPADGLTMMAWWDRTHGDRRGACNSVYIVEAEPVVDDMLAWWPRHFPLQAKHLTAAGVHLVEVRAS